MKEVLVVMPTKGYNYDEIQQQMKNAKEEYLNRLKPDISKVRFFFDGEDEPEEDHTSGSYAAYNLGKSIMSLTLADEVFFYGNWEDSISCWIKHDICDKYNIKYMEV